MGYPGSRYKGFQSTVEAEEWISIVEPQIRKFISTKMVPMFLKHNIVSRNPSSASESTLLGNASNPIQQPSLDTQMKEPEMHAPSPDLPPGPPSDANEIQMENLSTPSPIEAIALAPPMEGHENDGVIDMKMEESPPKNEPEEGKTILSDEQQVVLDLVLERKSVFFTGSAGEWRGYFLYILSS